MRTEQGTMRTLEARLKFDSGLTVGLHGVVFQAMRGDTQGARRGVVTIPTKGRPRITLLSNGRLGAYLTTYEVREDMTVPYGAIAAQPLALEHFRELTKDATKIIIMA